MPLLPLFGFWSKGLVIDTPTGLSSSSTGTTIAANASTFSTTPAGGDTHYSSQWLLATDSGFTNTIRDSSETTSYKTSYTFIGLSASTTYYWKVRFKGASGSWSEYTSGQTRATIAGPGEITYSPGTYSWVCPTGITSVSVVCIGGGGGSNYGTFDGRHGGDSYFINASIVSGNGGKSNGSGFSASGYVGDGGGYGGVAPGNALGGGGAGGYSGNGGTGSDYNQAGSSGAGGGGGGGGCGYPNFGMVGGLGGGTGLYGQGADGSGGSAVSYGSGTAGSGGSGQYYGGGANGGYALGYGGNGGGLGWKNNISVTPGQSYTVVVGAGGAAQSGLSAGGPGAVRIIWGAGRSFPSNAS